MTQAKKPTKPESERPSGGSSSRNKPSIQRRGRDLLVERSAEAWRGDDELLPVAKLGKTWGVHGHITVRLFNPDSDVSWADDFVWLRGEAFPKMPVEVDSWQDKGGKLLVRFAGVKSPHDASALTHLELLVPTEWLPDADAADEHYVHELKGMRVVDVERGLLGTIAEVFATGANDVWVVRGDAGETLIPAVRDFVLEVDKEEGLVRVRYEEL